MFELNLYETFSQEGEKKGGNLVLYQQVTEGRPSC